MREKIDWKQELLDSQRFNKKEEKYYNKEKQRLLRERMQYKKE